MEIVIGNIPIDVQKKNIKNMHLQVKPPDGRVVISAPVLMEDKAIEIFARTHLRWIRKSIDGFEKQIRQSKRQYVSGETMYIWGKQYYLQFVPNGRKNDFSVNGKYVYLQMNKKSTVEQRERYVREQCRTILKNEIERILPKWEKKTGIACRSWQTKYMTTRWGTCNPEKGRIWINLQLVQKPIECLEYVILHELVHFVERRHNETFTKLMDLHMPNWREVRKELNDFILDCYEAK